MKTVKQLLASKPNQALYSITPKATVFEALQLMADGDVGSLLVMDGDKLVGLFTERDYARKIILQGKASASTLIGDVMIEKVAFVRPTQTLEQCMIIMASLRVRYLPVMEDKTVLGILSITDLVREQIADQQFTIEQLEHYIHGWSLAQ
ncbi:MAG: CBS domain-containing protein [Burkholderiales bacterium]|nr:CBS domain-containing protein [Burkholderiales bacterium]